MHIAHIIAFKRVQANRIPFAFMNEIVAARIEIATLTAKMEG